MELFETRAPANAPACYAAPSIFSRDSQVCRVCPTHEQCEEASLRTLQELRKTIDVTDLLARHAQARKKTVEKVAPAVEPVNNLKFLPSIKPPVSPVVRKARIEPATFTIEDDIQQVIDNLNKNPATLVRRLAKAGVVGLVRQELAAGRNPLPEDKWTWVSIACQKLVEGGYSKQSLVMAYMTKMGWKETTANSHFVIVTPAFRALGLIVESEGKFVVNPEITNNNQ